MHVQGTVKTIVPRCCRWQSKLLSLGAADDLGTVVSCLRSQATVFKSSPAPRVNSILLFHVCSGNSQNYWSEVLTHVHSHIYEYNYFHYRFFIIFVVIVNKSKMIMSIEQTLRACVRESNTFLCSIALYN